jgi:hypothetical protein
MSPERGSDPVYSIGPDAAGKVPWQQCQSLSWSIPQEKSSPSRRPMMKTWESWRCIRLRKRLGQPDRNEDYAAFAIGRDKAGPAQQEIADQAAL